MRDALLPACLDAARRAAVGRVPVTELAVAIIALDLCQTPVSLRE